MGKIAEKTPPGWGVIGYGLNDWRCLTPPRSYCYEGTKAGAKGLLGRSALGLAEEMGT